VLVLLVAVICGVKGKGTAPFKIITADGPNKVMTLDVEHYNEVYIQTWFWVSIYTFGMMFANFVDTFFDEFGGTDRSNKS
jgi:hypothetical protein